VVRLLRLLRRAVPGDVPRAAQWAAADASLDDPRDVARLLRGLRAAGWPASDDAVTALLDRDPAAHASLDNPGDVADLLYMLHMTRASDAADALADRAAAHASLNAPGAVCVTSATHRTQPGKIPGRSGPQRAGPQAGSYLI
jgi:hypothetical protein